MGNTYVDITLRNAGDKIRVEEGIMKASDVRHLTVTALVDTGSMTLAISEEVRQKLGLKYFGTRMVAFGNGKTASCKVTEAVEVHLQGRVAECFALVVSKNGGVLLGAIPLEMMDLLVNPVTQTVSGAHGDTPLGTVLSYRVDNSFSQSFLNAKK